MNASKISTIFQFILGFILGVTLLAGSAAAAVYIFIAQMSAAPPKPVFSEENQKKEETEVAKKENTKTSPTDTETKATTEETKTTQESSPETPEEELPPGAYKARVNWPEGLIFRAEPSIDAERIGSILYDQELIILQESDDKVWQRVRRPGSDREGWVKAGNVEKIE